MIGIVTDSAAQLPRTLAERLGVAVVPIVVTVDDESFYETVDLADEHFYSRLSEGAKVSTAAPSPGEVLAIYERLIDQGATSILSIHLGSNASATSDVAQLASRHVEVPVEVVDSNSIGFGVGCCVWAAADVVTRGGSLEEAAAASRATSERVAHTFVIGSRALLAQGGRAQDLTGERNLESIAFALTADGRHQLGEADNHAALVELMADFVVSTAAGRPVRGGVGHAMAPGSALLLHQTLSSRLDPESVLVMHSLSPSLGTHMGAGTLTTSFVAVPAN